MVIAGCRVTHLDRSTQRRDALERREAYGSRPLDALLKRSRRIRQ
jgi:hypothetical protein